MDIMEQLGINLPEEVITQNKKEGRCSGHCCTAFTMRISKNDIRNFIEKRKKDPLTNKFDLEFATEEPFYMNLAGYPTEYFEKLLNMLVDQDRRLNGSKSPSGGSDLFDLEANSGFYTCKNLCTETGNCKDYENRPDFCQDYPVRGTCHYEGCTSSCAKNCGE